MPESNQTELTGALDLHTAATELRSSIGEVVRRMGQTRPEGAIPWAASSVVARLVERGPASSAELARAEGITPQSMGATLKTIEGRGFAERAPDPDDRRRFVYTVTAAGKQFYEARIDARVHQFVELLDEDFSDEEVRQLVAVAPLLERLAERLHAHFRSSG